MGKNTFNCCLCRPSLTTEICFHSPLSYRADGLSEGKKNKRQTLQFEVSNKNNYLQKVN